MTSAIWAVGGAVGGAIGGFLGGCFRRNAEINPNMTQTPKMEQNITMHLGGSPPSSSGATAGMAGNSNTTTEKTANLVNNYVTNTSSNPPCTSNIDIGFKSIGITFMTIGSVGGIVHLKERWDGSNDAALLTNLLFPHCGNLHALPEKAPGKLWGKYDCIEKRSDETRNAIHRLRKNNFPEVTIHEERWARCFVREEWRALDSTINKKT